MLFRVQLTSVCRETWGIQMKTRHHVQWVNGRLHALDPVNFLFIFKLMLRV